MNLENQKRKKKKQKKETKFISGLGGNNLANAWGCPGDEDYFSSHIFTENGFYGPGDEVLDD